MLATLRGATSGIVIKVLMVIIAASFAIWGIGDVFRGGGEKTLAKVGEREIGVVEFRNFLDRRLRDISRSTGLNFTVEDARKRGMDRQILGELLRATALDEQARQLKMSVSPEYIAKSLAKNPAYQDSDGNFNAAIIQRALMQSGISEQRFLLEEKQNMLRGAFTNALVAGLKAPQTLVEIANLFANEQRDVKYLVLTTDKIKVDDPSDKQLEEFYKKNSRRYAVPERRSFNVMFIDAATLGKDTKITDDLIKAHYEDRKSKYGTPETRVIEQIAFPDEAAAKKALEKIKQGSSFEDIAKEMGFTDKDRLLGEFTKDNVPDAAIGKAAFALKEMQISEPVKGALSVYLLRVSKIKPAHFKTIDEVRDELVKIIQVNAGRDLLLDLRDKVEDGRGGGATFKQIAKEFGLKYIETPPVDKSGLTADKKPVKDVPDWQDVVKAGFDSDVGVEMDPITTRDDGFIWEEVREVIPEHIKPLKEVADLNKQFWLDEQKRKLVIKQAEKLKEKAEAGTSLEDIARETGGEIKKVTGIKRNEASAAFGTAAVQATFRTAPDGYAVAVGSDGKSALLIKSSPVMIPPFDPKSASSKQAAQSLDRMIRNDVYGAYMSRVQENIGVDIRQRVWQRAFDSTDQ